MNLCAIVAHVLHFALWAEAEADSRPGEGAMTGTLAQARVDGSMRGDSSTTVLAGVQEVPSGFLNQEIWHKQISHSGDSSSTTADAKHLLKHAETQKHVRKAWD